MRPDTQCARILRVLADGKPHSLREIHRRVGGAIVHSRVSELRAAGYDIRNEHVPGRKGAAASSYQLHGVPADRPAWLEDAIRDAYRAQAAAPVLVFSFADGDTYAPRDDANRYRIYRLTDDEPDLIATTATLEGAGLAVITLAEEGEFKMASVGVMDAFGNGDYGKTGTWILNPYEARTR